MGWRKTKFLGVFCFNVLHFFGGLVGEKGESNHDDSKDLKPN